MYIHQLTAIFLDVLKIYQYYSEHISQAVAEQVLLVFVLVLGFSSSIDYVKACVLLSSFVNVFCAFSFPVAPLFSLFWLLFSLCIFRWCHYFYPLIAFVSFRLER